MAALLKSVSIGPGASTFAVIPLAPTSFATYLVNTSIAPFMEAYTEYPGTICFAIHRQHPVKKPAGI